MDKKLTDTEINEMQKKINQIMVKIDEVTRAVEKRQDIDSLRLSDKLYLVKTNVKNYIKSSNPDYLHGAVDLYMQTSGVALEGETVFNSTIWNAEVVFENKMVTLDDLFGDLCDLYYPLKKALVL